MKKSSSKGKAVAITEKPKLPKSTKSFTFFEDVYDVVRQVPTGRVTTYGSIASFLGTKMSARMVGWAMNAAHQCDPPVPAQRVVNRKGLLTGKHHFPESDSMEAQLIREGVLVKNDQVMDFEKIFWDPTVEISLH